MLHFQHYFWNQNIQKFSLYLLILARFLTFAEDVEASIEGN